MKNVVRSLQRRRKLMIIVVMVVFVLSFAVDQMIEVKALDYFEYETQTLMVYGLILYKLIELVIIYFIFYHRHMLKCYLNHFHTDFLARFEKNGKRFFMLVPQGNIVFGIISYKLTAQIEFLWLFLLFALITLWLVKPKHTSGLF